MQNNNKDVVFIATLLVATFLMGASFIAGKILIQNGFPALILVGVRFVVAAGFALPLLLLEKKPYLSALLPRGLKSQQYLTIALIGLLQTGGAMGCLFLALRTISAANGAILLFTNPLWVALLGAIFLGEKLNPKRLIGFGFGVCGVALAVGGQIGHLDWTGHIIGLCAAICWALSTTINKKANLPIGIYTLSFWQMLIGGCFLTTIATSFGQKIPANLTLSDILWFLFLAGPGSTASFSLWFIALRKGGATTASSYLFLAPLFAVILSVFILHSHLSLIQAIGGVLVGLAIYIINHTPPQNQSHQAHLLEAELEGEM